MIKSRFDTFASWIIKVGTFIFVAIVAGSFIYSFFDLNFLDISVTVFLYAGLLGLLIFLVITYNIKDVTIDCQSKTIFVKNLVTRQTIQYGFFELDGYYDIAIRHGRYLRFSRAIGLSKDGKLFVIIDSEYHSNLTEIRAGLVELKFLGTNAGWREQKF